MPYSLSCFTFGPHASVARIPLLNNERIRIGCPWFRATPSSFQYPSASHAKRRVYHKIKTHIPTRCIQLTPAQLNVKDFMGSEKSMQIYTGQMVEIHKYKTGEYYR